LKISDCRLQIVCKIDDQLSKNFNCRFSDIYIQEEEREIEIRYIVTSAFPIHDSRFNDSRNFKASFCLRSFVSSVC